jgi:hypothetical protein
MLQYCLLPASQCHQNAHIVLAAQFVPRFTNSQTAAPYFRDPNSLDFSLDFLRQKMGWYAGWWRRRMRRRGAWHWPIRGMAAAGTGTFEADIEVAGGTMPIGSI